MKVSHKKESLESDLYKHIFVDNDVLPFMYFELTLAGRSVNCTTDRSDEVAQSRCSFRTYLKIGLSLNATGDVMPPIFQ